MKLLQGVNYGPASQSLIKGAHRVIRELLGLSEGKSFLDSVDSGKSRDQEMYNDFSKGVTYAVPPITPVLLRNRSLDGVTSELRSTWEQVNCSCAVRGRNSTVGESCGSSRDMLLHAHGV